MEWYVSLRHTDSFVERPMEAIVAERGQITLPKAVRDALGLTKGSVLKVELEGSRIVLRKSVDDAISRVRGRFALDAAAQAGED
ncbi:AbrB/MazE/SpoVT family DNA-binding domain-containing protein [Pseudoxanthomonas daejeonensis]